MPKNCPIPDFTGSQLHIRGLYLRSFIMKNLNRKMQRDQKNIKEQLEKAANAIGIGLEKIKRSKRLTGEDKIRRDLLMNMFMGNRAL